MYVIDVTGTAQQFAPESSKLSSKATQAFMSYLSTQSDDNAKKTVANLILNNMRKLDHLNEKDLKGYIMRILDNLTQEQISDLRENPFKYSAKVEGKIKQLQVLHQMKKFKELLDLETIGIKLSYQLPKNIDPLKTITGITKSLYIEEGDMNDFEHKVILAIANLDAVERRHRNPERK